MAENQTKASQSFGVDAETVYKAWTEQDKLQEWWKPLGKTLQSLECELKAGGAVTYTFSDQGEDADRLVIEGEYSTVEAGKALSYTWNWILNDVPVKDGLYRLEVHFRDTDSGSEIDVVQHNESEEEGVHPHQEGWEAALNDLATFLDQDS